MSSATTPIQPASEPPAALVPREWRLRLDPLLLLAVLGLVACSIVTIKGATRLDVEGQPYFYVYRQALYAAVGLVLMYAVSRMDYTRLQDLRFVVYGLLIGSLCSRSASRRRRAAPRRGSSCRSSPCSRPSSARCCSSSPWPGSWSAACG